MPQNNILFRCMTSLLVSAVVFNVGALAQEGNSLEYATDPLLPFVTAESSLRLADEPKTEVDKSLTENIPTKVSDPQVNQTAEPSSRNEGLNSQERHLGVTETDYVSAQIQSFKENINGTVLEETQKLKETIEETSLELNLQLKKEVKEIKELKEVVSQNIRDQAILGERISNLEKSLEGLNISQTQLFSLINSIKELDLKDREDIKKAKNIEMLFALGLVLLLCCVNGFVLIRYRNALRKSNDKEECLLNSLEREALALSNTVDLLKNFLKKDSAVNISQGNLSSEELTSLIKFLADKITFMDVALSRMDPGIKGYKQLVRTLSQMKDNLRANGYEIVEMLGRPYKEGVKASASFKEDESLEKGTQIITSVIKPQINHNGVMIQSAQIVVSQNI